MEGCHRDHDVKDVCGGPRMVIRPPIYAPDPPPMAASLFSFQCLVPKERLFSVIHGVGEYIIILQFVPCYSLHLYACFISRSLLLLI
ncbi:hypothetical protein XENTR_v10020241 [Xenopus tropicalis]|nr:hypothetical protein XENTR_v10020229 [Xenopus tropicalis]KAE8582749.1 hypothetical protein XENTR_v10020236 [Xenopus tropicalis]KAE8582754.1 hypothetical protein XENTR_v10020241 [Xenopus tropicalis]